MILLDRVKLSVLSFRQGNTFPFLIIDFFRLEIVTNVPTYVKFETPSPRPIVISCSAYSGYSFE
jgi:hypothetical protein